MEKERTENELKKEFLNSYQVAKRDVIRLEQQLAELRINKLSPSCQIGDGLPHAHNITDLSGYAARVDELESDITTARYKRIEVYEQVRDHIEAMEDEREKLLLTYRYIRGMKWEEIAVKMDLTWRHTLRIHGSALKNFMMS